MKIKAGFYVKKLFWQLLWDDGYKEKNEEIWKKIQKIAVKRYCLPSSFYPFEIAFLKFASWI